jgi:hypothetical protein
MSRVERQLGAKECATGAILDIEEAFDSISNVAIKQVMITHIPQALVDWTENTPARRKSSTIQRKPLKVHQIETVHREGFYSHHCDAS